MKKFKLITLLIISLNILNVNAEISDYKYVFNIKENAKNLKVVNEIEIITPSCGSASLVSHEISISNNFCNAGNVSSINEQKNYTYWSCDGTNQSLSCQAKMKYNCNFLLAGRPADWLTCEGGELSGFAGGRQVTGTCSGDLNPMVTYMYAGRTYNTVCYN